MSSKDIRKFVEDRKDWFSSVDFLKEVLLNIPISTMLEEWLKTTKTPETNKKYSRAIERIFKLAPLSDLVEKNCAITSLDKNLSVAVGVYKLIEELDASKSTIKIYQSVYSKFCDFTRITTMGAVDPEETPKQKIDYYAAEIIYEDTDWESLIESMPSPFNLIAEMTFLAAKTCEYRLRIVDTRKSVLSLETSQINYKDKSITFHAEQSYHVTGLTIHFHDSFFARLKEYLGDREGTVFLTKKNKHLYPMQVQRAFKKASGKKPDNITPMMLGWAGVIAHKRKKGDRLIAKRNTVAL